MAKIGKLIRNGTKFYGREEESVNYLLSKGYNIELIKPSHTTKNKNPDIWLNGKIWEIKTPITDNKNTLERKITKGGRQSENLLIDLRFIKLNEKEAINILTNKFQKSRRVKNLLLITKDHLLVITNRK